MNWQNDGLNDAPVPIVHFTSNEPFSENLSEALAGGGGYMTTFWGHAGDPIWFYNPWRYHLFAMGPEGVGRPGLQPPSGGSRSATRWTD